MGNTSSISHPGNNLLNKLCGGNSIQYEDDGFWLDLFRAFDKPMLNIEPALIEDQLSMHCENLLVNNPITHHFQMLVLHTVSVLGDACQGRARLVASNALHLVWTVIKMAGDSGNGASLLNSLFEMTPSLPIPSQLVEPGSHQLLRLLVRKCLSALVTIRPSGNGWLVIQEIQHTLLVILAATQLRPYHRHTCRGPPGSHPGLEVLYSCQQLAPAVVSALLKFVIQRPAPPPECTHLCTPVGPQKEGGVVAAASALFMLPITALNSLVGSVVNAATSPYSESAASQQVPGSCLSVGSALPPSPLADTALLLLLLLVNAPDQPFNPYRWALKGLQNIPTNEQQASTAAAGDASREATPDPEGSDPAAAKDPTSAPTGVCFETLYRALARALSAPSILLPEQASSSGASSTAAAAGVGGVSRSTPLVNEDAITLNIGGGSSSDQHGAGSGSSKVDAAAVAAEAGLVSSGCEEAVLLLYSCIHMCPGFKDFVVNHSQPGVLLGPLCRALYLLLPSRQPRLLFMLQVLLLMLSQEEVWAKKIHHHQIQHGVAWAAKEYLGKGVTYGSLVLVVLLKTITTTWSASGNKGLVAPANALAALANMAPHVSHCHARAAQRLVNLLTALAKRFSRLGGLQTVTSVTAAAAAQAGSMTEPNNSDIQAQLSVLEDYIRLLLEVILLALRGAQEGLTSIIATGHLASNVELLYAVLQQQQVLDTLADSPRIADLVEQLQAYVRFFNQRLDDSKQQQLKTRPSKGSKHSEPLLPVSSAPADVSTPSAREQSLSSWSTCNQVLDVLLASLPDWATHYTYAQAVRHSQVPALKFIYEEETEPDTFFIPATWQLILLRIGSVAWAEPTADDSAAGQFSLGDTASPRHVALSPQEQQQRATGVRVSTSPGASPAK